MTPATPRPLERELVRLQLKISKLSERRGALPIGSSRARVTTLNAKLARSCEARDIIEKQLAEVASA